MRCRILPILTGFAIALGVVSNRANATLILTVDNYTTDELSFTISGTLDSTTIGAVPGWIGIKNDWSNNFAVHTELFSSAPTVTVDAVTIGGVSANSIVWSGTETHGDSVTFVNPAGAASAIAAGTAVAGSFTLSGTGLFNPADAATLELVSGFTTVDYARFEASAVLPEPATALLFACGLVGLGVRRRRD